MTLDWLFASLLLLQAFPIPQNKIKYSLLLPKSKMTLTILLQNLWCLIMLCVEYVCSGMQQKCIKFHNFSPLSLSHSLFDDVVVIIIAVVFFFYIKFLLLQCFLIFFSSPPPYWHVSWTMCVFFLFFFFLFVCILFIGILSSAFFPCKLKKCVCVKRWFFSLVDFF